MPTASLPAMPRAQPLDVQEPVEPLVRLVTPDGRDAFLERAAGSLPPDERLVKVVDLVGLRRGVRTTPASSRARLVAKEDPLVLRGGLTSLVSYWRVPAGELGARECHTLRGEESHAYDVTLQVACRRSAAGGAWT